MLEITPLGVSRAHWLAWKVASSFLSPQQKISTIHFYFYVLLILDALIYFFFVMAKNGIRKAEVVLVGTHMALHIVYSKTLECSVYRHPCFLVYGKIYNQLCFLYFSVPCFPTLEINLLDEAISNQFLRSRKKICLALHLFLC